ncbi:hypothetical protein BDQ17DRAFT_1551496 [Cyathus striatus]|nr:hypothetical protein BDQ17DRAFT_1551496 [Cyathus striatus]
MNVDKSSAFPTTAKAAKRYQKEKQVYDAGNEEKQERRKRKREVNREACRRWKGKNPEVNKEACRKWREKNLERNRAQAREYYWKKREKEEGNQNEREYQTDGEEEMEKEWIMKRRREMRTNQLIPSPSPAVLFDIPEDNNYTPISTVFTNPIKSPKTLLELFIPAHVEESLEVEEHISTYANPTSECTGSNEDEDVYATTTTTFASFNHSLDVPVVAITDKSSAEEDYVPTCDTASNDTISSKAAIPTTTTIASPNHMLELPVITITDESSAEEDHVPICDTTSNDTSFSNAAMPTSTTISDPIHSLELSVVVNGGESSTVQDQVPICEPTASEDTSASEAALPLECPIFTQARAPPNVRRKVVRGGSSKVPVNLGCTIS